MENDGFGPVFEKEEQLVDKIIDCIKNDSKMDEKYEKRVDSFFEYKDNKNCERVFDSIVKINKDE